MTLQVRTGGAWVDVTDPQVRVGGSWHNVENGYVRVAGAWEEFYSRDTTGPAAPTGGTATWNGSDCDLSWTNPGDSDYDHMLIYRNRLGVSDDGYIDQVSGATHAYSDPGPSLEYGVVYRYTLVPVDTRGNAGTPAVFDSMGWTGSARGRTVSPITIYASDSGTYRGSSWRTDSYVQSFYGNPSRMYQGYTASGMNYGHLFYGTQFYDQLRGATISSMDLTLWRSNSAGLGSAVSPRLWFTDKTAKSGAGNTGIYDNAGTGRVLTPGLTRDDYDTYTLTSDWHDYFFDPSTSPRARGFVIYDSDTSLNAYGASNEYMLMQGYDEFQLFVFTHGQVVVTHSG